MTDVLGMGNLDIYCTFRDVPTFAWPFLSDLLPSHPLPGFFGYTVIVNTDVHTEPSSHCVAVHMDMRSSNG